MVDKELIRRLHKVHGWSERRIARELGFARMTVRKDLREDAVDPPRYHLTRPRAKPVLGPVLPIIRQWLADDEQQPFQQRRTAHRIWTQLREEHGFSGDEATVRALGRQLKAEQRAVDVPLAFAPGERVEVDWGTAQVVLAGKIATLHLFCARLRSSGMPFVMAFPDERQEAFFAGHRHAFECWGGVPRTVVYDNLTTAVRRVLSGHRRVEQDAFVGLRMHYLFEAVFCNPAAGHEKGAVENLVGTYRRHYLAPMPEVRSLEELNAYLLDCCQREARETHQGRGEPVAARWAAEREHLLPPPPAPFDCARRVAARATSTAEVCFETNRYSVPVEHAYQPLVLTADVTVGRIYKDATLIAEHPRCYGRHQRISDWRHYVPLLAQKPAAVPFAAALRGCDLAPVCERFRQGLGECGPDGNREFVRVLELCVAHPAALVTRAVKQAVAHGAYQVAAVEHLLGELTTPPVVHPPLDMGELPELAALTIPAVRVAGYNALVPRGGT